MSDLTEIQAGWDHAAHEDALFNILTEPGKENGGWDDEEFFARGETEIQTVLDRVGELFTGRREALDFGCGVGRLTQALAGHFDTAHGVDIAPEMIRKADYMAVRKNAEYHLNSTSDLSIFETDRFDFIYSRIALQHMPHHLQKGYVREFLRVLDPAGIAVFDVPDGPEFHHPNEWLSMYGASQFVVQGWITEAGGEVIDVIAEGDGQWVNKRYVVR